MCASWMGVVLNLIRADGLIDLNKLHQVFWCLTFLACFLFFLLAVIITWLSTEIGMVALTIDRQREI